MMLCLLIRITYLALIP